MDTRGKSTPPSLFRPGKTRKKKKARGGGGVTTQLLQATGRQRGCTSLTKGQGGTQGRGRMGNGKNTALYPMFGGEAVDNEGS